MLTEKQKEAINIIIRLRCNKDVLNEEEFYLLIGFITENKQETQYVPYPVDVPNPIIYPHPWITTCKQ